MAKEQTAAAREEKVDAVHKESDAVEREDVQAPEEFKDEPENESEPGNGGFRFLRPGDGLICQTFFVPVAVLIVLFARRGAFAVLGKSAFLRDRSIVTMGVPLSFLNSSTS